MLICIFRYLNTFKMWPIVHSCSEFMFSPNLNATDDSWELENVVETLTQPKICSTVGVSTHASHCTVPISTVQFWQYMDHF